MFESLSDRFESVLGKLKGKGKLSEADVDEALREIRLALLEADVNFTVVKNFCARIRDRAVGEEVSKALNPGQQMVKIVNDELTATLGGETIRITYNSKPPTVVLMAGLQGSGKTTNSAKLARWFKSQGRHPLLVGADLQRPAAVEQLRTLGRQIEVPVFSEDTDPVQVAKSALTEARKTGRDVVIVDTAGRLAIDADLMDEVRRISEAVDPDYTFLVIDAMTGQDAVNTAEAFHATLELDGVILTKLDGDARGGAALSVKEVVGRPIAFTSTGEKLRDFDLFHPDRLAGRILGMGDMLTLIEKAEEVYEKDQAEAAATRLLEGGTPLIVVASLLGWSASTTARMAKRYGHISHDTLAQAVRLLTPTTAIEDLLHQGGGHRKGHSPEAPSLSNHSKLLKRDGSSGWIRTSNPPVNSRMLCR